MKPVKTLAENFPGIQVCVVCLSSNGEDEISDIMVIAQEVSTLIEKIDPYIQKGTAAVCPSCASVCCINRHAYHTHDDILFIHALGENTPSYKNITDDAEPCGFLGERGCTIRRPLRPYRCTWYFCTPLLEYFKSVPAIDYRNFIGSIEKLTYKRQHMLGIFEAASLKSKSPKRCCKAGCIYHAHPY